MLKSLLRIVRPLTVLTKKNQPYVWGDEQQNAMQKLKGILCNWPVLAIYDPKLETELHTDASKWCIGGILMKKQSDNRMKPVQ